MTAISGWIEPSAIALLALWSAGSVAFNLAGPRLRRRLDRANPGLWFARWTVFGSGREHSSIGRYVLEYRDGHDAGEGTWIVAMEGRPWRWHACIWQPERRVADRIHRIGQDLAILTRRGAVPAVRSAEFRRVLANHLAVAHPRPAGLGREIRIRERRATVTPGPGMTWAEPELTECVVLQAEVDDHER